MGKSGSKLSKINLLIGIINMLLIFVIIAGLMSGSSISVTKALNEVNNQIVLLHSEVSSLADKVANTPATNIQPTTSCTGTLNQYLSGSSYQSGNISSYSLTGSSPLNLTCRKI